MLAVLVELVSIKVKETRGYMRAIVARDVRKQDTVDNRDEGVERGLRRTGHLNREGGEKGFNKC